MHRGVCVLLDQEHLRIGVIFVVDTFLQPMTYNLEELRKQPPLNLTFLSLFIFTEIGFQRGLRQFILDLLPPTFTIGKMVLRIFAKN